MVQLAARQHFGGNHDAGPGLGRRGGLQGLAVRRAMSSAGRRCGRASCICTEKNFHHVRPKLPEG